MGYLWAILCHTRDRHRLRKELLGIPDTITINLKKQGEKMGRLAESTILVWCIALAAMLILVSSCGVVHASEIDIDRLANAIYKTENSKKYPYGIKSIKCNGAIECRRICINSIRNNLKRWKDAGYPEDFIIFMGRRYSPPDINPNWVRLVKYFYNS